MPRPAPLPNESMEIVAPDALRAFKEASAAKTTARANRWLKVAAAAQDDYVKKVRERGIAHPGTTRRRVLGRGRKRTRKSRRYLGRWL